MNLSTKIMRGLAVIVPAVLFATMIMAPLPATAAPANGIYVATSDSLGLGANRVTRVRFGDYSTNQIYQGGDVNKPAAMATDREAAKAFMALADAAGQKIAVIDLNGGGTSTLAATTISGAGRSIAGVALDRTAGVVYYSADSSLVAADNRVQRVKYDGTLLPAVYSSGGSAETPRDLAVDHDANKLFIVFTNGAESWISVAGLDGSGLTEVSGSRVGSSGASVGGLALDTVNGYLYYTVTGSLVPGDNKIYRCKYDGTERVALYTGTVLDKPSHLALDQSNNIYAAFTGSGYQQIKWATLVANPASMVWTQVATITIPYAGISITGIDTISEPPTPPTVTTGGVTNLTATGATLNGTANGNDLIAGVSFDYGLSDTYGTTVAGLPSPLLAGSGNVSVSADLSGLACNTTYHYRITAQSSAGTTNGSDLSFTTSPCPIAGACGSSNGQTFKASPASGLCSPDSTPELTATLDGWQWSCAGQYGGSSASCSAVRDNSGPTLQLSTLTNGSTTGNPTLNLEGVVTDPAGVNEVTINGAAVTVGANGRFSHAVRLAAGGNTITTVAKDTLDNESTDARVITLDLSAPALQLSSAPTDNSTVAPELVDITTTTADSSVSIDIRLNGTVVVAGTGPTFGSGPLPLLTGFNTIEVIATDLAGKKSSLKRSIFHDSTKASLALTTPFQDQIVRTPYLAYSGSVADAVEPVVVKVSTDGGATFTTLSATTDGMTAGTFSGSTTFTTPGMYTIFLKAVNGSDTTLSEVRRNVIYIPENNSFNTDDNADLIWTDSTTNSSKVWFMNGVSKLSEAGLPAAPGTGWAIVGKDDFNNDGNTDIVWRNQTTGQNLVWYMDGVNKAAEASLPTIATAWVYGGSGDFNGDGKSDIVWRNPATKACNVWYMDGATRTGNGVGPTIAAEWSIGGIGDFDKDGIPDIIWRNPATSATNLWFMNADFSRRANGIGPTISSAWILSGVADFDKDGVPDIIFRNPTTGANNIWYMKTDFTRRGNGIGTPLTGSNWSIVGK